MIPHSVITNVCFTTFSKIKETKKYQQKWRKMYHFTLVSGWSIQCGVK